MRHPTGHHPSEPGNKSLLSKRKSHYNHADSIEQDRIRWLSLFVGNYFPLLEDFWQSVGAVDGPTTRSGPILVV